jgi:hypothetical protein
VQFKVNSNLSQLGAYIPYFLSIVGEQRWFKRADQLDSEQRMSPSLWKIVADYHWLEMAISQQSVVLAKEGRLLAEHADPLTLAALHFAGAVVEVHDRLGAAGRRQLEGRLRDGLQAESGFAALYLELDLTLRLMAAGYDVRFPDLDGTARFDIEFSHGSFIGEVECKSLSADAGRRIHRKDFYRFIEATAPAREAHATLNRREVIVITLRDRLSPNATNQADLRRAVANILRDGAPVAITRPGFHLERRLYSECLADASRTDSRAFYAACVKLFGPNTHVAGELTERGGCLVVMRSEREDDTSKPLLDAMRKAAGQFSGQHPSFIAVQFQDIEAPDLMLPSLRRRSGILSHALFEHFGAAQVNATYFCAFAAVIARGGQLGAPGFAVPNPQPKFAVSPADASPFLVHLSDADFAAAIGAQLPAPNISYLPFGALADGQPEVAPDRL